jgi:hypothetical protein
MAPDGATLWDAVNADPSNRLRLFSVLPVEVLLYAFSFCTVTDLCRLCSVSKRLHVILDSPFAWLAHCERMKLPVVQTGTAFVNHPKQVLRDVIVSARERLTDSLHAHENELLRVEERIRQRIEQAPPFAHDFVESSHAHMPRLQALIERTQKHLDEVMDQAKGVEATRQALVSMAEQNRDALRKSQRDLQRVLGLLEPHRDQGNDASLASAFCPVTSETLQRFERRICRVILQNARELPVVLRRGTSTFSSLELLVLQLGSRSADAEINAIRQRWSAFKSFFPALNNGEYFALRDALVEGIDVSSKSQSSVSLIKKIMTMSDAELSECAM